MGPAKPTAPQRRVVSSTGFPGLSANYERDMSLLREWLDSFIRRIFPGSSPEWKKRIMPGGRTYWELKSSAPDKRSTEGGYSTTVTTPTATMPLVKEWDPEGFYLSPGGRWRKRTKKGVAGSMNWAQEMMVRMVTQNNPKLLPTPEACEQFMGIPTGWTKLSAAELASVHPSRRPAGAGSPGMGRLP